MYHDNRILKLTRCEPTVVQFFSLSFSQTHTYTHFEITIKLQPFIRPFEPLTHKPKVQESIVKFSPPK